MDRERIEADVREARDYLERGLIVPNAVVRAIDHCEQLLAALAEAEQQLATLRLGGVPNRMLDAVAKERDEARAALAALEAEVDGPSGLREQLGAARKGTQIEKRMRDRLEAENERLREIISESLPALGCHARDFSQDALAAACEVTGSDPADWTQHPDVLARVLASRPGEESR